MPLLVFLTAPTLAGLAMAVDESVPSDPRDSGLVDELDIETMSDAEAAALLAVLTGDGEAI